MPLVIMNDMLHHAYRNGYAVGAFDLPSLDFPKAIAAAAESAHAPVILPLAESHFGYFDFELTISAVEIAAQRAAIPVVIHLDHGTNPDAAAKAIRLGCNGVKVDASPQPSLGERTSISTAPS